jgi:Spy/CpxP family protein refolding chaperone
MSRTRNLILLAASIAALVLVFSLVYADTPERPFKGMRDDLGLTDAQVKQMQEIQYDFAKTGIGLRADMKEARLALQHELTQPNVDQKEVDKLVDQVAQAQKMLLKHRIDRRLAMKNVLTPEQWDKFQQMRGGMMMGERMGERTGHRMGKKMGEGRGCWQRGAKGFGPHGDGPGI